MAFLATQRDGERIDNDAKFELALPETTIGRLQECGIVVDAKAVSRMHAKVVRDGSSYYIEVSRTCSRDQRRATAPSLAS